MKKYKKAKEPWPVEDCTNDAEYIEDPKCIEDRKYIEDRKCITDTKLTQTPRQQ